VPKVASTVSFSIPNGSFMAPILPSPSEDLTDATAHLPSFSSLATPLVLSAPTVQRKLDVALPIGVSISDYWPVAFNFNSVPIVAIAIPQLTVVYCSPSFLLLVGGDKTTQLCRGDRLRLQSLSEDVIAGKREFFLHAFAFVSPVSKCVLLAEGNAASCLAAEGYFLVVEIKPLYSKKPGECTSLSSAGELNAFRSFFASWPQPCALLLPSGYIVSANTAFVKRHNSLQETDVVGEDVCELMPRLQLHDVLVNLWQQWIDKSESVNYAAEDGSFTITSAAFTHGHGVGQYRDQMRWFVLVLLGPSPSRLKLE